MFSGMFYIVPCLVISAGIAFATTLYQFGKEEMEKHHALDPLVASMITLVAILLFSFSSPVWLQYHKWDNCGFVDLHPVEVLRYLHGDLCAPCNPRSFYLDPHLTGFMEGSLAEVFEDKGWHRLLHPARAELALENIATKGRSDLSQSPNRRPRCFVQPVAGPESDVNRWKGLTNGPLRPFEFAPEMCIKDEFLTRLFRYYRRTHTANSGHGLQSQLQDQQQDMYKKWDFLPETYTLEQAWQRKMFFDQVPCTGKNSLWLLKGRGHGGRAINHIEKYESLWQAFGIDCQQYKTSGEPPDWRNNKHHQQLASGFIAQKVVPGLTWPNSDSSEDQGRHFVCRTFMIVVKVPSGFVELYLSTLVFFIVHDGLVSDHNSPTIELRSASELNAWIDQGGRWVEDTLVPEVSKILSVSFNASAETDPTRQLRAKDNFEELDGAFEFFAGDFIITEGRRVKLLEFSGRPEVKRLKDNTQDSVLTLLPALADDTATLLMNLFSSDAGQAGVVQHWKRIAQRPALPHV